jgi:hypothetical protein
MMEVTQEAQLIVLRTIYGPVMDRAAHVSRPGFVAFDHAVRAVDTALAAKEADLAAVKAMLVDDPNWIAAGIPDHVIEAGMEAQDKAQNDLANYVSGVTPDWDEGMICAAIFKAMLRAALSEQQP